MYGNSPGSPSSELLGDVGRVVERLDLDAGVGEAARVVGADDRGDVAVVLGGAHWGAKVSERVLAYALAMRVRIRLFAMLRERAGTSELELELPDGACVRDALAAVEELAAGLPLVMAVNREYADADAPLAPGDELALIPPVSRGHGCRARRHP